ncbi:MAG: hypothetical protein JOZ41_12195 [Chloroflexi bacterium]|nr:hypothetical protein [Chloroflexota bacterium]
MKRRRDFLLVVLLLIVLVWVLGAGNLASFNANLHLGGGLETLLILVLVVVLVAVLLRRF